MIGRNSDLILGIKSQARPLRSSFFLLKVSLYDFISPEPCYMRRKLGLIAD